MVKILFWFSLIFIFYTYFGYPLILLLLSFLRKIQTHKRYISDLPYVSVVISARNEEGVIVDRLENLLQQDYPLTLLEIVVVSDNSTDTTNILVSQFAASHSPNSATVKLLLQDAEQGKPAALNKGISQANGEIIVFADCRQRFSKEAIKELVANFQDPTVGCVSGELVFVEGTKSDIRVEMGAYWQYEKFIRRLESATGSVVGATGAIYAIRKKLFKPLPHETLLDDVLVPLYIAEQGNRIVFDRDAVAFDNFSPQLGNEWRRKTRTLAGNWQLLSLNKNIFNPFLSPLCWRFFSHKVSRLFVPFLLPVLLVSSFLGSGLFFRMLFWIQFIGYLTAFFAHVVPVARKCSGLGLPYFFCVLNMAALVGWYRWISGGIGKGWR